MLGISTIAIVLIHIARNKYNVYLKLILENTHDLTVFTKII